MMQNTEKIDEFLLWPDLPLTGPRALGFGPFGV
jgi:hypothetical protein